MTNPIQTVTYDQHGNKTAIVDGREVTYLSRSYAHDKGNPCSCASCREEQAEKNEQVTDFEHVRISIMTRTSTGLNDGSYTACKLQSGEMLRSAQHLENQAILVFENKYGTKPGFRTVILTATGPDKPLVLVTNVFGPRPTIDEPTLVKSDKATLPWQSIMELSAPMWWRVLDAHDKVIADNLTDERYARLIAAGLAEFGARLVSMKGSNLFTEKELV